MENFTLYEELGSGSSSVVFKARRKGSLNYVAVVRTNKAKRPEITNHVRLCQDLDHPNIVRFYEWYATRKHLWLVVELCTGGSLDALLSQDGRLSLKVVRSFGWDLVQGLQHIHHLGIIVSHFTPAQILLDGSGSLKFSNFCRSKAEGEKLEDFFALLSTCDEEEEEEEEGAWDHSSDDVKKRLQGSPAYMAPEVLQGSETSMKSDLWALGCVLYFMSSGQPPFSSENYTELKRMILHEKPPPPKKTEFLPSEDFHNLLEGLLNKNPEKRLDFPDLLCHPFWTARLSEEEEEEDDEGGMKTRPGEVSSGWRCVNASVP